MRAYGIINEVKHTYFWLLAIFPDASISYMAWSRHLTSSVGQRTSEEKTEATEPAQALCTSLKQKDKWAGGSIFRVCVTGGTTGWPLTLAQCHCAVQLQSGWPAGRSRSSWRAQSSLRCWPPELEWCPGRGHADPLVYRSSRDSERNPDTVSGTSAFWPLLCLEAAHWRRTQLPLKKTEDNIKGDCTGSVLLKETQEGFTTLDSRKSQCKHREKWAGKTRESSKSAFPARRAAELFDRGAG